MRKLRRLMAAGLAAAESGLSLDGYLNRSFDQTTSTARIDRREFLRSGSALGVAAVGVAKRPGQEKVRSQERIAIVGAGAAGLTVAYRLEQRGLTSVLFDAWNRVGGRMFSSGKGFRDGQVCELGGELIDTNHLFIRNLAAELGLSLDYVLEPAGNGIGQETDWFGGKRLTPVQVIDAFSRIAPQLAEDSRRGLADPVEFDRIDRTPMSQYLESLTDLDPDLKSLISEAYVGEMGLELEFQSTWNLLGLIDFDSLDEFRIYGDSDEAYHIHGGNDQVPKLLKQALRHSPILLEHRLLRVNRRSDGTFVLAFGRGNGVGTVEYVFDRVVLALPFTMLRHVEFNPPLPPEKYEIVQTLGYGTNAKLMSQYSGKIWREQYLESGIVMSDNGLQTVWETSRGQTGVSGILTCFTGGNVGVLLGEGTAEDQILARLPLLEQIYPGISRTYLTGSAVRMHWPTVPVTMGSYHCPLPGQTRLLEAIADPVGLLHFCGEHAGGSSAGFMDGAVRSGERVANEIAPPPPARRKHGNTPVRAGV